MEIQTYTDYGYQQVPLETVELDMIDLVGLLYDKKILSADDINSVLPSGLEVVE